jgi:DegV family protein with EDD domain
VTVHILADTTSCISPELGRQHGITVVPQLVDFSGKIYREWLDLTPADFVKKLQAAPEMPNSTPSGPEVFAEAMRPLVEAGDSIVCIMPSRLVSKTYDIVQQAAQRFPGADIRLVDTRLIASPNVTLALQAAQWAALGQSAEYIAQRLERMATRGRVYFLVSTLEYLAHAGRIGGAEAWLGNLLQLKPILTFTQGQVDRFDTVRTFRHALIRLADLVLENARTDWELHLTVMHAGDPEQGQALAQDLAYKLDVSKVPLYDIPPTVACHTGPGTLGVAFFVGE